jgi:hypothetical protein
MKGEAKMSGLVTAFALAAALIGAPPIAVAEGFQLAPFKDDLFAYPKIIKTDYGGDFAMVEFIEERDVNGRDEIPLRKAFDKMVDLRVNERKEDLRLRDGVNSTTFLAVGRTRGDAKIIVIFMHGLHGDRTLAMEDLRFGGNFNRLKNLMVRNDGVYISPDFQGFGEQAKNQIKVLMKYYAGISPGAPIILGCASTSCKIAYRLLEDPESAALLSGVVLFGGSRHDPFLDTPVFRNPEKWVPIYIGHGSKDTTNNWVALELFFKAIKKAAPNYPIKFDLFVNGVHGTPIRMSDWRMVINWMLDVNDR